MRVFLALMAGAVAWMAVVASQSNPPANARWSGARRTGAPRLPGHYSRLANYYRVHLN